MQVSEGFEPSLIRADRAWTTPLARTSRVRCRSLPSGHNATSPEPCCRRCAAGDPSEAHEVTFRSARHRL